MASVSGPRLVTDSLVLLLDAGNPLSYSGSGNNWYEKTGSSANFSLTNSPTFNSSNKGSIVFNGSNQYANAGNRTFSLDVSNKTICGWVYPTAAPSGAAAILDKDFDNTGSGGPSAYGGWGFWINSSYKMQWWAHANKDLVDTGTSLTPNKWNYACLTWNTSTKLATFYLNGVMTSTQSNSAIVEQSSGTYNTIIGAIRNASGNFLTGRVSIIQAYNRILTSSEIQQNYNAHKSRFGLS